MNIKNQYKKRRSHKRSPYVTDRVLKNVLNMNYDYSLLQKITTGQFEGIEPSNPITCAWFGCGKHLSLEEQRFGKYCSHHNIRKPFDVTLFLKYP